MKRFLAIYFDEKESPSGYPLSTEEIDALLFLKIEETEHQKKFREHINKLRSEGYENTTKEYLKNTIILHIEE